MNKLLVQSFSKILFVLILVFTIYSCDSATVSPSPEANSISGKITFVDTNFTFTGGYYDVAAFATWPPTGPPSGDDSLIIVKNGNTYTANYKIQGLTDGNFVIAVGWRSTGPSPVLGVYGCDTAHTTCILTPSSVAITNSMGVENIDFLSWADLTQSLYP